MLLPLGTDRPLRRPTLVNHWLIGLNVAVFLAHLLGVRFVGESFGRAIEAFALDPAHPGRAWTFVTYAFLHSQQTPWHLLGNMIFLWTFGPNVEDRLGRLGYPAFYLLGAAAAGGTHALFDMHPVVGASGAVSAVAGAYLVLFPKTRIRTVLIFFIIGLYWIRAWWFIGFNVAWNLVLMSTASQGNVAVGAHLGGYLFGFGVGMVLLWTGVLKREPYDLLTIGRQAKRRREIKDAAYEQERAVRRAPVSRPDRRSERTDALASMRSELIVHVGAERAPEAAGAYRTLLTRFGHEPGGVTLPRANQLTLANMLLQSGEHQLADTAYSAFLAAYPRDMESPAVHLMLGLICARYLNDPVRAEGLLRTARAEVANAAHRDLAEQLLGEIGAETGGGA